LFTVKNSTNIELKWIFIFRTLFAIVLAFSTLIFCFTKNIPLFKQPFVSLYMVAILFLITSVIYLALFKMGIHGIKLIYIWAIIETFFVTSIIYITGSFESIFIFLYLIVIMCSTISLYYKGGLIVASVAGLQYCTLIWLDYYGIVDVFTTSLHMTNIYSDTYIIFKIVIVVAACYAIAILSGILALNAKNTRHALKVTQGHLKRVERMGAVDEMLSGITHEIKNPLASLSGSIQLLKENATPGSSDYRLMQIVLRETQRLQEIVNNFRLFIRPGKSDARATRIDTAIHEIVELFLHAPEYNDNINVVTKINENVVIEIDPVHFKQIIWNLLINAAQAMDNTGEIRIILEQPLKGRIYLNIIDTGCGIDEKNSVSVFDPFFTTKDDGTGLGLSIVHKLVDLYNGIIDFESTPGQGTAFTVIFKGYLEF